MHPLTLSFSLPCSGNEGKESGDTEERQEKKKQLFFLTVITIK